MQCKNQTNQQNIPNTLSTMHHGSDEYRRHASIKSSNDYSLRANDDHQNSSMLQVVYFGMFVYVKNQTYC